VILIFFQAIENHHSETEVSQLKENKIIHYLSAKFSYQADINNIKNEHISVQWPLYRAHLRKITL